ncbi:MAG: tRNA-dihydrouridine synthase [Planctomycetota bacterium]|nr:tRNA-dihydrouridine synthase [Planctomycetota bacterium]
MLQLGPVQLKTPLLLAPIAGYCDLAFRTICREWGGVGLACTDLLSPHGLLRGTATSLDLAQTNDFDKPVGMQLYGSDPAIMAEGAKWAVDHGATIVDINMGCPVDKVTKKDGGSKLLCDLDRAVRIAEACVRALDAASGGRVPLTCKMRLGWSWTDYENGVSPDLACRLVDVGVVGITVHGRTTEMKFQGDCVRPGIKRVVDAVRAKTAGRVKVIGNGDVREPHDAINMIRDTGCDGVMIGRGALSTPWIFRDAAALLAGEALPAELTELEKIDTIKRFVRLMMQYRGEHYAMFQIRRRMSWFAKRLGPCKPLREAIRNAKTPAEVDDKLDRFLAGELRGGRYEEADAEA